MFSHLLFGKDVKIKTQKNNIYLNKVMGSSVFVGLLMIALWIWGLVITIKYWNEIPNHFDHAILDTFVIMPNHIHGIIFIDIYPVHRDDGIASSLHKKG